jgi:CheY-like chemotaxis protein
MKVLIADDENIERNALIEILKNEPGIDIIETKNGQEALDVLCERLNPDLCLLDIKMPILDGVELLKRIRHEPLLRHLKVVITSASRDKNVIMALAQLGISGYLLKPYQPDKVMAMLRPLLGSVAASRVESLPAERNLLSKTLLVVDDDPGMRKVITELASMEGWRVVEASNGEEGLALIHNGLNPDLCFSDLLMPKMDGVTFIKSLRELSSMKNLPIVVISSDHKAETIRSLAALNVTGFIVKPFDIAKIKAHLGSVSKPTEDKETPSA